MTSFCGCNGRREVNSMKEQKDILRRQVESMKGRLNTLDRLSNVKRSANGGDTDQLGKKIEEVGSQVSPRRNGLTKVERSKEFVVERNRGFNIIIERRRWPAMDILRC